MITLRCPSCGRTHMFADSMAGRSVACSGCGQMSRVSPLPFHLGINIETRPKLAPPAPRTARLTEAFICRQCGGEMVKTIISSGNCTGILLALVVLGVGITLTFVVPICGWIIGPLLCLVALGMGGKRRKVWKCEECNVILERA